MNHLCLDTTCRSYGISKIVLCYKVLLCVLNEKELRKWMHDHIEPCESLNRKMATDSEW